jgi:hypothetical protein
LPQMVRRSHVKFVSREYHGAVFASCSRICSRHLSN